MRQRLRGLAARARVAPPQHDQGVAGRLAYEGRGGQDVGIPINVHCRWNHGKKSAVDYLLPTARTGYGVLAWCSRIWLALT